MSDDKKPPAKPAGSDKPPPVRKPSQPWNPSGDKEARKDRRGGQ